MTREEQIRALIDSLELVRQRPAMFMGWTKTNSAEIFLAGFDTASEAVGIDGSRERMVKAGEARGWEFSSTGFTPHMRERGMGEAEMVDELIAIHIDAYRSLLSEEGNEPVVPSR